MKIFLRIFSVLLLIILVLGTVIVVFEDVTVRVSYASTSASISNGQVASPGGGNSNFNGSLNANGSANVQFLPSGFINSATTPGQLIINIYEYALGIVGVVALGALIYGAVLKIVSSGVPSLNMEGNNYIIGALSGLALLIGGALILNTIDPNLLNVGNVDQQIKSLMPTTTVPQQNTGVFQFGKNWQGQTVCNNCNTYDPYADYFNVKKTGLTACSGGVNSCQFSSQMTGNLNKLSALATNMGIPSGDWQVTEAWPPTVQHNSQCHYNGSCVDIALDPNYVKNLSPAQLTDAVQKMMAAAKQAGFSRVVNEYKEANGKTYNTTTGDNIHIQI